MASLAGSAPGAIAEISTTLTLTCPVTGGYIADIELTVRSCDDGPEVDEVCMLVNLGRDAHGKCRWHEVAILPPHKAQDPSA